MGLSASSPLFAGHNRERAGHNLPLRSTLAHPLRLPNGEVASVDLILYRRGTTTSGRRGDLHQLSLDLYSRVTASRIRAPARGAAHDGRVLVPVPDSPCGEHRLVRSDVGGWAVQCVVCGRYWKRARCQDGPARRRADELLEQVAALDPAVLLGDLDRVEAIAALAETLRALRRESEDTGRPRWRRRRPD